MTGFLKFFAWISLAISIVATIISVATLSQLSGPGTLLGLVNLVYGIFVWALLMVIADMSDRTKNLESDIKTLLERVPPPPRAPAKSYSVMDRISGD